MRKEMIPDLLVLVGLGCLTVAAWILHVSAGLAVAGLSAVIVGVGIARGAR